MENARLLVVKLDNIIIDGKKIHANLPRFESNGSKDLVNQTKWTIFSRFKNQSYRFEKFVGAGNGFNSRRQSRTFAKVLANNHAEENEVSFCLWFSSREVDRERFSIAKVGLFLFLGLHIGCNQF